MENENDVVNTMLTLSTLNTTFPSTSRNRNRKKQKKLVDIVSPIVSPTPPLLRSVKHKLLPGCLVHLDRRTELYSMFTKANLETLLYYKIKKVIPNMVNEFYNNMKIRKGVHDLTCITTVVNGRTILLDHIELGKAPKLFEKVLNLANIDISKEFFFNKSEFKLYLSVLCGIEIPHDMFNEDSGISYEHFTHTFQNLALIIRANLFPNTSSDKLVRFAEVKLMYKLTSHEVNFNVPYMIIMHMIDPFKKGYMSYGLLLTKVFEHFNLNVDQLPHFQISSTISIRAKRTILPLAGFGGLPIIDLDPTVPTAVLPPPPPVLPPSQINFEKEFAKLKEAHEELDAMFQSLQDAYKKVVEKVDVTEAKVGVMDILGNIVSRAGKIEDGLSQLINIQLGMVYLPFLPLLSDIEDTPVIGNVSNDEPVVAGVSAMETDLVDTPSINPSLETMD